MIHDVNTRTLQFMFAELDSSMNKHWAEIQHNTSMGRMRDWTLELVLHYNTKLTFHLWHFICRVEVQNTICKIDKRYKRRKRFFIDGARCQSQVRLWQATLYSLFNGIRLFIARSRLSSCDVQQAKTSPRRELHLGDRNVCKTSSRKSRAIAVKLLVCRQASSPRNNIFRRQK